MALNYPASGGGDFKQLPAGNHLAVCDIVADLGIQPGNDLYPKSKPQVYIRFEVPSERIEWEKDGKKMEGPAIIGRIFTASMHEKAGLRIFLESWRGRKFNDEEASVFDVSAILGKACMLNAVENLKDGKVRVKIGNVSPLPKGFTAPGAELALILYSEEDRGNLDKLQPWLQEKIKTQILLQPKSSVPGDGPEYTDADLPAELQDEAPF
jgi:hypothetical protein